MENEQTNSQEQKLSYDELVSVTQQLQSRLQQAEQRLAEANSLREMVAVCMGLLERKDALRPEMLDKILDFFDKLIPVPKAAE